MNWKKILASDVRRKLSLAVVFVLSIFFSMCSETPTESNVGEKFVNSHSSITMIDTFSVKVSTIILDSLCTSSSSSILVGNYSDNTFGKIKCSSYFTLANPDSAYLAEYLDGDTYDSLNLVIKYNKYSFGDTTKYQKYNVYRLTEKIRSNSDLYITNNSSFRYNPQAIGSICFKPYPHNSTDTLSIKISNTLGNDLWNKIKNGSEIIYSDEIFQNYFYGLVLVPDDSYEGAILGFKASSTRLILYTSRNEVSKETISYDFALVDTINQSNYVKHDLSTSQVNSLAKQRDLVPSDKSNGLSFIQGGVGLAARIDFPSLNEILLKGRGTILKAELTISPLENSYKNFALPSQLYLYDIGKANQSTYSLQSSSSLVEDDLYQENTIYTFDITSFITGEAADKYVDSNNGLLVTLVDSQMQATLNRLIINGRSKNMKLKIYYLSY
jgi:hypothetical protein